MPFDVKKIHKRMMITYVALTVVVGGLVLWMLVKTQWIDREHWRKVSNSHEMELRTDLAQRGTIYSSDHQILATTMEVCDLYLDLSYRVKKNRHGEVMKNSEGVPIRIPSIEDSCYRVGLRTLCRILDSVSDDKDYAYYYNRINDERRRPKPKGCFIIQRGLPFSVWDSICNIDGWGGAVVKSVDGQSVKRDVRAHIYGNMAGNTVGFYSRANVSTGLEGYYDSILRGQDGQYWCRRLTRGVWIEENSPGRLMMEMDDSVLVGAGQMQKRIDGSDIVATIDTRFQDIAQSSLREALMRHGAQSGCAVLMEMETGYVLACSNLTWDSTTKSYLEKVDHNIACSDLYEPGSTFKSVILTAMMNDSTVKIDTAERVRVGHKVYSLYSGEITDGSHSEVDTVSLKRAVERSSNVGMCELGWRYYKERRNDLRDLVTEIFPYEILNLDVTANESHGKINDLGPDRDFLNFCYGYANSVSVMQLLTFYNALGAGGRMVKPLFCKGIIVDGEERLISPVVINEQICSPRTAQTMRDVLVGVVENGTGNNIKNSEYGIAGKTGTAVYNYKNKNIYTASFAGFFPAERPKYSCVVVVKSVATHGRQAAAPVFKKIADCVVSIDKELGYVKLKDNVIEKKELDRIESKMPITAKGRRENILKAYEKMGIDTMRLLPQSEWVIWDVERDSNGTHARYIAYDYPKGVVPNCKGMTIGEALPMLREMGLRVKFKGYGRVVDQSPKARTPYRKGDVVYLNLRNK